MDNKTIMAIDPGKAGGIAWFDGNEYHAVSMPATAREICDVFEDVHPDFVLVEQVTGFIAGQNCPSSRMFNFGYGVGILHGLLTALRIPNDEIRPQKWQKALSLGTRDHKKESKQDWKRKLKRKAEMLFPNIDVTLKNADALLILTVALRGLNK